MATTKKPVVAQPPKTAKTYKDVLNQKQSRFWQQANQILKLGGTLSKAQQQTYNTLLNQMKKAGINPTAGITVQVPKTNPLVPTTGLTPKEQRFWQQANQITQLGGQLNANQQKTYSAIANKLRGNVNQSTLQDLSIRALNGDMQAQNTLKSLHLNPLTGQSLWKGYDPRKLQPGTKAYKQYMADNPHSDLSKEYDLKNYQIYTERIKNNQPIRPDQQQWYNYVTQKWGLPNYFDPNVQYQDELKANEKEYTDQLTKNEQAYLDALKKMQDELKANEKEYTDQLTKNKQEYLDALKKMQDELKANEKEHSDQLTKNEQEYLDALKKMQEEGYNRLTSAQQSALDAQDVALNNALFQADNDNFQRFLQLQQEMADRGMGDSGIAADAYLRSQMAANQAYQDAYAQAAKTKADILSDFADRFNQWQSAYTDKVGQTKADYTDKLHQTKDYYTKAINEAILAGLDANRDYTDKLQQTKDYYTKAINEAKLASRVYADKKKAEEAAKALELQKLQSDRDKFLTEQTGYVFVNGKPLKRPDGKPYTTVELQKLFETARHNKVTEENRSKEIQVNYELGKERNDITAKGNQMNYNAKMAQIELDRQKIAQDGQIAMAKLKLAQAKLDLDKQKAQDAMNQAQAKLDIMAKNAQTSEVRTKITAIKTQLSALQKQIDARLKAGNEPTKAQRKQLKGLMDQLEALVSGK